MLRSPKVLLLTSSNQEARSLQEALGAYAFLARAANPAELQSCLGSGDYDAVFCAWSFYQSDWGGPLSEVRERYPELPMIVLSHSGDQREWREVLEAGAFDLLALPCQRLLALAVTEQAADSRQARRARQTASMEALEGRLGSSRQSAA